MNIRELKDSVSFHVTRASKEMVGKAVKGQFVSDKWCREYLIYYGAGRELYEGCGWVHVLTNTKIKGIAYFVCPKKEWDTLFAREKKNQESLKQASREIHAKNK